MTSGGQTPIGRAAVAAAVAAGGAFALVLFGLLPLTVFVLSLPFLWLLAARPVLRRLAVRSASRRPRETALVVLGSLLGTAIITGSFIVGDTLDASIRRSAYTQLGPVDEVVAAEGAAAQARIAGALAGLSAELVDGVVPVLRVTAAVATPEGAGERRAEPKAELLEIDFDDARAFGNDPAATGFEGSTPTAGSVVIGRDLARTLEVGAGDDVDVFAYGTTRSFTVERVLERRGLAGFRLELDTSQSPNLFLPPGTIAELVDAGPLGQAIPPTALVAVSNVGGVIDGADRSPAVVKELERRLSALPASVFSAKADVLEEAEEAGASFTELFTAIGFFSVLAGVLLLINIFVALAQERKTELGMLRAVGLRRTSLMASFSLEGWLYALAAAVVGAAVGIGVGRLIVLAAAGIFGSGDDSLELGFSAELASIQAGFTVGFIIALVTVVGSSLGIARLNVIRAIRDLPEPAADRRRRLLTAVLGALGVLVGGVATARGISSEEPFSALGGPGIVGLGLVAALGPLVPRRLGVSVVSAAVLVWAVVAFDLLPEVFTDVDIILFVVQGVLLTASAVAAVSQNQEAIGGLIRRLGGGSRSMTLRLGLAYPLARRFRTAMILSMYTLVVFTLTFITVLSALFAGQVDDFTAEVSGGYDLVVESNPSNPVPADELSDRPEVEAVAELAVVGAEFDAPPLTDGFEGWPVAGADEAYFDRGRTLNERDDAYPDDAAAFDALLRDRSLIIISDFFLQDGGGPPEGSLAPGDDITMREPLSGETRRLTIAGILESGFGNALAYLDREGLEELYGDRVTSNLLHVATAAGTDVDGLAGELNGRYLANGGEAETFRSLISANLAQQQQFFRLMQGYLALGLLVGIAGLGVVAVRAVRERRHQVGVLRSLGFEASAVRRAFLAESAFVSLEGILIGVALALVTCWRLVDTDAFGADVAFDVPWGQLSFLVVATFAASLVATATPAQQASRIRPAVALRLAD